MINAYIGTHNSKILSVGAAKYLRKNIVEDINITLICDENKKSELVDPIFDNYIESNLMRKGMRSAGFNIALGVSDRLDNALNLYIDDDLRLMEKISLNEKYSSNVYVPLYCKMIFIWRGCFSKDLSNRIIMPIIKVENIYQCYEKWDEKIKELAVANTCEKIDDIWLHIDKGSLLPWPSVKTELVNYLDSYIDVENI
jgi:hypothetical protein